MYVIIALLILIFIIIVIWYGYYKWMVTNANDTTEDEIIPTLHAKCNEGLGCGGELVCDTRIHRCKQPHGGSCSDNIDCMAGLYCSDWVCSDNITDNNVDVSPNKKSDTRSHIKWVSNETFYYNISG